MVTYVRNNREKSWLGMEPSDRKSQVQRPNHYTIKPPNFVGFLKFIRWCAYILYYRIYFTIVNGITSWLNFKQCVSTYILHCPITRQNTVVSVSFSDLTKLMMQVNVMYKGQSVWRCNWHCISESYWHSETFNLNNQQTYVTLRRYSDLNKCNCLLDCSGEDSLILL